MRPHLSGQAGSLGCRLHSFILGSPTGKGNVACGQLRSPAHGRFALAYAFGQARFQFGNALFQSLDAGSDFILGINDSQLRLGAGSVRAIRSVIGGIGYVIDGVFGFRLRHLHSQGRRLHMLRNLCPGLIRRRGEAADFRIGGFGTFHQQRLRLLFLERGKLRFQLGNAL